jgi:hypothetical protein
MGMNRIVSVPLTRLLTPCTRHPNSFAADLVQTALASRFVISSQYNISFPVVGCITAFTRNGILTGVLGLIAGLASGCIVAAVSSCISPLLLVLY